MKGLLYAMTQTVGWFACTVGAARGLHWLGPLVVAWLVVLHVGTRGNRSVFRIMSLTLASIPFGFCFDSLLILSGVYEPVRWVVPAPFATLWLLALWVNFALIVDVPLRWLQNHLLIAAILGAIFGPAAYLAAQRLGAIRIAEPGTLYVTVLAAAWAVGLAGLMFIAAQLPRSRLHMRPASNG
jgi:hypothetical protein